MRASCFIAIIIAISKEIDIPSVSQCLSPSHPDTLKPRKGIAAVIPSEPFPSLESKCPIHTFSPAVARCGSMATPVLHNIVWIAHIVHIVAVIQPLQSPLLLNASCESRRDDTASPPEAERSCESRFREQREESIVSRDDTARSVSRVPRGILHLESSIQYPKSKSAARRAKTAVRNSFSRLLLYTGYLFFLRSLIFR